MYHFFMLVGDYVLFFDDEKDAMNYLDKQLSLGKPVRLFIKIIAETGRLLKFEDYQRITKKESKKYERKE